MQAIFPLSGTYFFFIRSYFLFYLIPIFLWVEAFWKNSFFVEHIFLLIRFYFNLNSLFRFGGAKFTLDLCNTKKIFFGIKRNLGSICGKWECCMGKNFIGRKVKYSLSESLKIVCGWMEIISSGKSLSCIQKSVCFLCIHSSYI